MPDYDIGDKRRLTATFKDISSVLTDPTTVTFNMIDPAGVITTFVTGVDAEIVNDSTGVYHVDWTVLLKGIHKYEFVGVGSLIGAEASNFKVRESAF